MYSMYVFKQVLAFIIKLMTWVHELKNYKYRGD